VAAENFDERLNNIIEYFTYSIYVNCCRSLFAKHKLMFSFLLFTRIMQGDKRLDQHEYKFLLAGPTSVQTLYPNPAEQWLPQNAWIEISNLSKLTNFHELDKTFVTGEMLLDWKRIYDSVTPHVRNCLCLRACSRSYVCVSECMYMTRGLTWNGVHHVRLCYGSICSFVCVHVHQD
jgi:hypothetical protein